MLFTKKAVDRLTSQPKKWYNISMDIVNETEKVNERIAKNLTFYRKAAGFTQAELAQKINYSDKSVSKWESANGVPDIYILFQLASLYGVTVNDLVSEELPQKPVLKKPSKLSSSLIMILSVGIVWLIATLFFVTMNLFLPHLEWWLTFLYALPVSSVVTLVLSAVFKRKMTNFVSLSSLIWSTIVCVYVSFKVLMPRGMLDQLWMVFLIGVPLQLLDIFWVFFRNVRKKNKKKQTEEKNK